jgi:hypothetical protein
MKKGETLSATARADRARETAKAAMARELFMAAILGRLWPLYVTDWTSEDYPHLLCLDSPAGLLVWRLSQEELSMFEHLPRRPRDKESPRDRLPVLQALASS